jgi:hypothetical protein
MVVSVDQTWQYDVIAQIQDLVGFLRQRFRGPNRFYPSITNKDTRVGYLASMLIHGHEYGSVAN